jgi:DNA-binding CsgD family transcriptional regulator
MASRLFHTPFTPIGSVADTMQMSFNMYFMTRNHEIRELNEACCHSSGFHSRIDAIGRTIANIVTDKSQVNRVFANDQQVITKKQLQVFDESVEFGDGRALQGVSFKFPLYDNEDRLGGIFGCTVLLHRDKLDVIAQQISVITSLLLQKNIPANILLTGREINGKYFSAREVDVIQWMVRGKTMREIGIELGLSKRTIESYVENIKTKMGVNTKSQLIQCVMSDFN